jgi:hypothetical protein
MGFNANSDPAFNLNADSDPGSVNNADPDPNPGQTCTSQKVDLQNEKYTLSRYR